MYFDKGVTSDPFVSEFIINIKNEFFPNTESSLPKFLYTKETKRSTCSRITTSHRRRAKVARVTITGSVFIKKITIKKNRASFGIKRKLSNPVNQHNYRLKKLIRFKHTPRGFRKIGNSLRKRKYSIFLSLKNELD